MTQVLLKVLPCITRQRLFAVPLVHPYRVSQLYPNHLFDTTGRLFVVYIFFYRPTIKCTWLVAFRIIVGCTCFAVLIFVTTINLFLSSSVIRYRAACYIHLFEWQIGCCSGFIAVRLTVQNFVQCLADSCLIISILILY